jgi:hypothetical protein
MHLLGNITLAVFATLCSTAHAADQTILGNYFAVKEQTVPKASVLVKAKEPNSPNTIVGDPTVSGATLTVTINAVTSQPPDTFNLPQGVSATGKPFWSGSVASGKLLYKDSKGENSAVKILQIKTGKTFQIKAIVLNKLDGGMTLYTPAAGGGIGACALIQIVGGDSYSVNFNTGEKQAKDGVLFAVKKPTAEGTCVTTTSTTSTTTTTLMGSPSSAFVQ